ncbi:cupredoxin domain-containing protein [Maribacter polysiphoniae]|uniref:Cupredoxin domain-containing protein n=1 Tax=Maribacter polysiphoniae TaxID=429344 RepID=A0A316ERE8_9FLAO|nr:cupredoxin domain-containing protein [Maribacter polysiphoniae]MBD1260191.1 cupredoxin domain-containing protein [Maribacter polysiphoniae]PWK25650.1 Cupredoxin-like domain-containing protein [Maribacter polysiphoniae]
MKKIITLVVLAFGTAFSVNAQDKIMNKTQKTISLEQTSGEFTQKQITVSEGTYVFEIANNAVGHDVGFVLVEKGKDIGKPENHIQTAYVTEAVATGKTQKSKPTKLEKGEYVYFCPLNPTATDNTLIVK